MKALTPTTRPRKRKRLTRPRALITTTLLLGALPLAAQDKGIVFAPPPFTVADGFEISLAAAPPLVSYPMMACFDDRGRLYIAESDGRNLTTRAEIEKELPRFVRRLVDTDGDGIFDRSTIFADKMTMPEGGLWHQGALYIISPPYLWRLEDTDDDGVADKREKILGSMEFDGRANQHGPYLGPNGRFYFTGGHFGYKFEGSDGSQTGTSRAAGVFSCWPDGSDVRIEGQGGINPVEVVFTRSGEMLSTCAIFDSFGGKRHDALIHWIPGGLTQRVYGAPLLPETGYRLPAVSRWGQVAPAGLVRYRGANLGAEFKDTLFACHFNTNKVLHVQLVPSGATFTTEESDFLSSTNIDFRPADILEDADGSLLLIDTGGWLSWGCPHSKTAKPEVKGAIYRIRRKGAPKVDDPRGLEIDWQNLEPIDLANLLASDRPAVRDRARATLIDRGKSSVPVLTVLFRKSRDPNVRQRCLWTLSQIKSESARSALHQGLKDENPVVRQAAVRSLGILKDDSPEAGALIVKLLSEEFEKNASVRRAAATALGQIGGPAYTQWLFDALQSDSELYFQHAVTLALIEIGDELNTASRLVDDPHRQKTALRVLDQLNSKVLTPSGVVRFLNSPHPEVRDEARQIIAKRTDWVEEVLEVFADLLREEEMNQESAQLLEQIVLTFSNNEGFNKVISDSLSDVATKTVMKLRLLTSLSYMDTLPESLHDGVRSVLMRSSPGLQSEALAVVLRHDAGVIFAEQLQALASNNRAELLTRLTALEAITARKRTLAAAAFTLLSQTLRNPKSPVLLSRQAARTLGHLDLPSSKAAQAHKLCDLIAGASPLQLPALVRPFESLAKSAKHWPREEFDQLGVNLAAALRKSPGRSALSPTQLSALQSTFSETSRKAHHAFKELAANNLTSAKSRQAKLTSLLKVSANENASRGRGLFHTNRATCALCHRVNGRGGSLGPNLSKIGGIRSRRDLLEAIVFPSATVVNGFESYVLTSDDGTAHTGLVQRETADAVYLRNADQRVQRVPRDQIKSMLRSPLSAMPEGLDAVLTKQELADLVAFLETCR